MDEYPEQLPESGDKAVRSYQRNVEENLARQRTSFRGHLGSFVGVNAMLAVIWVTTGAGFPWFLIPLFGWGIGLASHYTALQSAEQEYRGLSRLGTIRRNVANLYRKLTKNRRGWASHLTSTVATSALLVVINGITWGGFPWAIFPIAGMSIGLFTHYPGFRSKDRRLLRQLAEQGVDLARLERGVGLFPVRGAAVSAAKTGAPGDAVEQEARQLREVIVKRLEDSRTPDLGEEFRNALDGFVTQVAELQATSREIEGIIAEIPQDALEKDLRDLRQKRDSAESERMREEYDTSIAEVERQQRSYASLQEDAEMIRLRVNSAMNALRQMNIDLLRMRSSGGVGETAESLRSRALELSRQIEDLHNAYEELRP